MNLLNCMNVCIVFFIISTNKEIYNAIIANETVYFKTEFVFYILINCILYDEFYIYN